MKGALYFIHPALLFICACVSVFLVFCQVTPTAFKPKPLSAYDKQRRDAYQ